MLPLAAPAYVVGYVYADLLDVTGPLQSLLRDWAGWQAGDYYFPAVRSLPGKRGHRSCAVSVHLPVSENQF